MLGENLEQFPKKSGFSKMIFHCKNRPKEINFGNIKQQFTKRGEK
jgi:hypothetical protein